jgi:AcrR family transcriptional regulator
MVHKKRHEWGLFMSIKGQAGRLATTRRIASDTRKAQPMPLRQQQKLMTRDRILDAAVQVFLSHGYADATIDDIVAASAIGRATFYLHFKSKLEVMRAIIQTREEQNQLLITELDAGERPTRTSIEAWLHRFVGHWAAEGDRYLVGMQALASEPGLSDQLEAGVRQARNKLAAVMERDAKLSKAEAGLRAELLVGTLQRACRALVTTPGQYRADMVVRLVSDIWCHVMKIDDPVNSRG